MDTNKMYRLLTRATKSIEELDLAHTDLSLASWKPEVKKSKADAQKEERAKKAFAKAKKEAEEKVVDLLSFLKDSSPE